MKVRVHNLCGVGLQQGSGLVGSGCAHLRDGSRLPALLRRPADPDLREDREWQGALPLALQQRPEGTAAQSVASGPHQEIRQPQERRQRHQGSQVVRFHRLDRHIPTKGYHHVIIHIIFDSSDDSFLN